MKIRDRIKELRRVPGSQLAPNPKNWRTHPKAQLDALRGVLAEIGWAGAHLARELPDGTLMLIDGHARAEIAGGEVVPVLVTDLTEEEADFVLATFDPIGALAGAEATKLDDLAKQHGIFEEKPQGELQEDQVPALPKEVRTKLGDLWILGNHRLLCGDSTKEEDVVRLMNGEKASLFATDPPYLVNYDEKNHPKCWADKPSKNKDWSETYEEQGWDDEAKGEEFLVNFIALAIKHALGKNPAIYVWHSDRRQRLFDRAMQKNGILVHQQILWFKSRPVLTRSVYLWQHEPCFFGWIQGKKPANYIANGSEWNRTVWQIPSSEVETAEHSTSKPVRVFGIPMNHHTKKGEVCYEPFSGSGSQIIAAEQLERKCYAMELSPAYVDVAVRRWEELTGKQAVLASH